MTISRYFNSDKKFLTFISYELCYNDDEISKSIGLYCDAMKWVIYPRKNYDSSCNKCHNYYELISLWYILYVTILPSSLILQR